MPLKESVWLSVQNLMNIYAKFRQDWNVEQHRVTQVVGMGKGDGHADNDFSFVSKAKCAKYH